jgi:magnesium transporter
MIAVIRREGDPPQPIWIDAPDPAPHELDELAKTYRLHPNLVADCLEPMHLPKHEQHGDTTFMIVRSYSEVCCEGDQTVQSMTQKIAVFLGNRFLITVHKNDARFLDPIVSRYAESPEAVFLLVVMLEVLLAAVETYQTPLEEAEDRVHAFENAILTDSRDRDHWEAIFHTQARLTVIKRMLWHTLNAVQKFVPRSERNLPLVQDLRERIESLLFFTDNLLEDLRNLLAVQLSLAANDTNDVMRTLAMYSVIFMPLTFIVGVYGMNFRYIPELGWRWGYAAVWVTVAVVAIGLWRWFRMKRWL